MCVEDEPVQVGAGQLLLGSIADDLLVVHPTDRCCGSVLTCYNPGGGIPSGSFLQFAIETCHVEIVDLPLAWCFSIVM